VYVGGCVCVLCVHVGVSMSNLDYYSSLKKVMVEYYLPLSILHPSTFMFMSLLNSSKKSHKCFPHSVISTNMFLILLEVKAGLRVDRMSLHLCPVSEM
jgi:hypothetical protein